MQFSEWLQKSAKTRHEVSVALCCSRAFISQLALGQKSPSLRMAFRIEKLTAGKVKAASWPRVNGYAE